MPENGPSAEVLRTHEANQVCEFLDKPSQGHRDQSACLDNYSHTTRVIRGEMRTQVGFCVGAFWGKVY